MAKSHHVSFFPTLVIGWTLASLGFSIAFLQHDLPAQSNSPVLRMSSPADGSATTMNAATTVQEGGNDDQLVHRYESPFFPIGKDKKRTPSVLIVLNTPIKCRCNNKGELSGVLGRLWEASSYRICADGGANRLYDVTVAKAEVGADESPDDFLPDLITGDLDSVRPGVRRYYEARGVSIVRVEDQNFHDLDVRMMQCLFPLMCCQLEDHLMALISLQRAEIADGCGKVGWENK